MSRVCLLIADRFEPTADLLVAELRRRDVACVRWNLDRFPLNCTLTYRASNGGFQTEVASDGRKVDLDNVGSVWCRALLPSGFPDDIGPAERKFADMGARRALDALVSVTDTVWINHPVQNRLANSKPAQLYMARKVGLDIPATVITNDPDEARTFTANSHKQTVYKSLTQNWEVEPSEALFTGLITDTELANVDLIRLTPGIFQEFVPKSYEVRATVVGSRIFSAKIYSQAHAETKLDWRHSPLEVEHQPIDLPREVETKIHGFMEAFGLIYGAFDFIVTPEGRHVFLEVNVAGQYMWVESKTGLKITAALGDALSDPCRV